MSTYVPTQGEWEIAQRVVNALLEHIERMEPHAVNSINALQQVADEICGDVEEAFGGAS